MIINHFILSNTIGKRSTSMRESVKIDRRNNEKQLVVALIYLAYTH